MDEMTNVVYDQSMYIDKINKDPASLLYSFPKCIRESIFDIQNHIIFEDIYAKKVFKTYNLSNKSDFFQIIDKLGNEFIINILEIWTRCLVSLALRNELNIEEDIYNVGKINSYMNSNHIGALSVIVSNTFIANYILEHLESINKSNTTIRVKDDIFPKELLIIIDLPNDIGIKFTLKENTIIENDVYKGFDNNDIYFPMGKNDKGIYVIEF